MMETRLSCQDDTREQAPTQDDYLKTDLSSESVTLPDSQHSSIEERERLRVYLRIRPFTSAENNNGESQDCVTIKPPDTVLLKPPSWSLSARLSTDKSLPQTGQRFQFSQVYGPQTTQSELFRGTVKDMVKDVLEGGSSLVFTYGVTNAGKTFTFLGPDADAGILPRSLDVIFSSIDKQVFTGMSIKPHRCLEFTRLSKEQQAEEALFKRSLLRQLKESEISSSLLNSTSKNIHEDSMLGKTAEENIGLDLEPHTKFSVWVSFCEIYNENIHDLLEEAPSRALRRTALRLSQDVKGNAFIRDLRWVQVSSAEEAYMVMKFGKRNQSFSSTLLNQLSSRSHSIFSIRILRIEDIETPRVHAVSELSLCDLAGSERCAKTQNKGERLKEAGNINTSLLILGKCINALRLKQQARLLQHIPFRESKLTHYLQGFFCGRGKACMIVNINQCASMYDETLNVLRFSAVAQKVVVLSTRPLSVPLSQTSTSEVSMLSSEREVLHDSRSSVIGGDTSLEDVQEDEECEEETSLMDGTVAEMDDESDEKVLVSKRTHQRQEALVRELQLHLKEQQLESIHMEARVREDVSREFSALFSEMQDDYRERLVREREILEERAERRLEIFKDLIDRMATAGPGSDTQVTSEMDRAEQVLVQLQTAQSRVDGLPTEIQEQTSGRRSPMLGARSMEQEAQTAASLGGLTGPHREVSELRKNGSQTGQIQDLERELTQAKEQLANTQLISEQQRQQLTEKLTQREAESEQKAEGLREKLHQQEELYQQQLAALGSQHGCREQAHKEEVEQLRTELEKQTKDLEKQLEQLNEKLREQEIMSQQQLQDLRDKLSRPTLNAAEEPAEDTVGKASHLSSGSASEEDVKRLTSVLQADRVSLKATLSDMESTKESLSNTEALLHFLEDEKCPEEGQRQVVEKVSPGREAELQKQLLEKEAQITFLQKTLQRAQERREEEESRAIQDARHREVERRRELLTVAQEAIAQKEAELEKKAEEIRSLKENAKEDGERVQSLSRDLQRKEEDMSDLKEKLADYKKQIQQVHHEISSMREEGKALRQKLSDLDKAKKCLQSDIASRDKIIQQLRAEQSCNTSSEQRLQLYQKACKDLEAQQRVVEDMRLALMEQEETQSQMEQVLEEKLNLIQELSSEVEKLKGMPLLWDRGNDSHQQVNSQSEDLKVAKQEGAQAQENLKLCTEKHQAERRKWLEEKLSLIGQAKEAEDKRNQEMRKFVEDRERYSRQQSQLESQMAEKEETMERWRKERDTLVAALEVQLQKLLSSQSEKDKLIQQLRQNNTQPPPESGDAGVSVAELLTALSERDAEILWLKRELQTSAGQKEAVVSQTETRENPASLAGKPQSHLRSGGDPRASVSSQGSAGGPSVLDSSEISTENGRTSRFPRPELEISFSPLQPNRMALRRQGEESSVTIKISRSARKRKSGELEKSRVFRRSKRRATPQEEVEAQNRRNTRTKLTPRPEETNRLLSSPAGCHDSQSSIGSRKEGALLKIGEFLQSSPTLLSSKAKMMMSLVSGRGDADAAASSSSLNLRSKRSKRKLFRPEISSPIDMPSHPIISRELEEKESNHQTIKRRLRSRMAK